MAADSVPGGTVNCPACGHAEPAGSKFCGKCGTGLAQPTGSVPKPASPPKLPGIGIAQPSATKPPPAPAAPAAVVGQPRRKPPWRVLAVLAGLVIVIGVAVYVLTAGPSPQEVAKENYDTCEKNVGPFLEAVRTIDDSLDVGANLDEYQDLVASANVAEGKVTTADLDAVNSACNADVYDNAVSALDLYRTAADDWNQCVELYIDDPYYDCELETDTSVYENWDEASSYVEDADSGLEEIRTPAPSSE